MTYLFTTKACPKCEVVKRYIEEHKIKNICVMDCATPEGRGKAIKYELRAAPTLVITDNDDNLIDKYSGDGLIIHHLEEMKK